MIRSMTGFASVERQYDFGRLTWELRSVNHRYLEIGFRVPEEFRVLEPDIRRVLGEFLSRGKVDAALRFTPAFAAAASNLTLNRPLFDRLLALHAEMQEASGRQEAVDLGGLMRWPGVIEEQAPDPEPLHAAALELLREAAAGLQSTRVREWEQMAAAIRERLATIESRVSAVRTWLPEIRDGLRQKLLGRVADLEQPLEPGRLEQEVAFLAQKLDVDEELDRPGVSIARRPRGRHRRLAHAGAEPGRQRGCRRLFDDLLVTPLDGTLALKKMNCISVLIAHHLNLNMAGFLHIFFHKNSSIAEIGFCLALGSFYHFG